MTSSTNILTPLSEHVRNEEKIQTADNRNSAPNYAHLVQQIISLQQTLQEERRCHQEKDDLISQLKKDAYTDELTGIFNRRGLLQAYAESTSNDTGVVALVDLDRFKPINDTFGHDAGDEALKLVARSLANNIRQDTDIVARYGGDEFLVILKGAKADEVKERINILQKVLNNLSFDWEHEGTKFCIKLSGSIGIAPLKPGEEIARLKTQADKELYRIKKEKGHKRFL